jgi:hypothetical protein
MPFAAEGLGREFSLPNAVSGAKATLRNEVPTDLKHAAQR